MAQSDDPNLHILESLVTYRFTRLADTLIRAAAQVYRAHHGVTVTELRLLATIGHHQPLALNGVSRLTGIDKGWVSRSLAALVERKLVARRPHPTDSRVSLLSLTNAGQVKVQEIVPLAAARNERFLDGIGKAKRVVLDELLAKLQRQAEDMLANPGGPLHRAGRRQTPRQMPTLILVPSARRRAKRLHRSKRR
jgi:DNA-binding MarR family transcriptional regulator